MEAHCFLSFLHNQVGATVLSVQAPCSLVYPLSLPSKRKRGKKKSFSCFKTIMTSKLHLEGKKGNEVEA